MADVIHDEAGAGMTEDEKRLLLLVGRIRLAELVAEHSGVAVHPRVRDAHRRELEAVLAALDPTRVIHPTRSVTAAEVLREFGHPAPGTQEDGA